MTDPYVYLLAAGKGERAGGPKAWAEHKGKALLQRHVEFLRPIFGHGQVVVAIQDPWLKRCVDLDISVSWVSADPEGSPLSSLQRLLETTENAPGFVYHVDMPLWDEPVRQVFISLVKGLGSAQAAVPTFTGKRGHPVLLAKAAAAAVAALDPEKDRLDAYLRSCHLAEVPVHTELILANWNEGAP